MTGKQSDNIEVRWWDEAETVLYYGYFHPFEFEEFKRMLRQGNALISAKQYKVDVIIDYRHLRTFPVGVLFHGYEALNATPTNLHYNYTLLPDLPTIRLLYNTFLRLNHDTPLIKKYRLLLKSTPEEAYQYILAERLAI
jgi:hypothetical protein